MTKQTQGQAESFTLRMSVELRNALDAFAKLSGMSVSQIIVTACHEYLTKVTEEDMVRELERRVAAFDVLRAAANKAAESSSQGSLAGGWLEARKPGRPKKTLRDSA